jgi:hypothetical protein
MDENSSNSICTSSPTPIASSSSREEALHARQRAQAAIELRRIVIKR